MPETYGIIRARQVATASSSRALDMSHALALGQSVRQSGQAVPALVRPLTAEERRRCLLDPSLAFPHAIDLLADEAVELYHAKDGLHRTVGVVEVCGADHPLKVLIDTEPQDALAQMRTEAAANTRQRKWPAASVVAKVVAAREQFAARGHDLSIRDLCAFVGVDPSDYSRARWLETAPPELFAAARLGKLTDQQITLLGKVKGDKGRLLQLLDGLLKTGPERLTLAQLKAAVAKPKKGGGK